MKSALVSGHTGGLGEGFAQQLLDDGWRVYGMARGSSESRQGLRQAACDLVHLDAIGSALETLLDGVPGLDLVILNAGVLGRIEPLSQTPVGEIQRIMDINVWANKVILDWFLASRMPLAQVVLISSGAAANASYGWGAYSLSKAALNTLARLYAHELTSTHLTALAPGLVDTAMQDYLCAQVDSTDFPSVRKLKEARGTEAMPDPPTAAGRILTLLPRLRRKFPSGSFVDIRDL